MWHCSALFFLRYFHGLSESALQKDPLHLLLQPANYNTVIKCTWKQLPSYTTVSSKQRATFSSDPLSSPLRKVEIWFGLTWFDCYWRILEESIIVWKALHMNEPKSLWGRGKGTVKFLELGMHCRGQSASSVAVAPHSPLEQQVAIFSTAVSGSWVSAKVQRHNHILFLPWSDSASLPPFFYDNNSTHFFLILAFQLQGEQNLRFDFAW